MPARRQRSTTGRTLRRAVAVLPLAAAGIVLGACEFSPDPETGETRPRVVVPGTPEHAARIEDRWRRCLEINSATVCRQRHGAPPPGVTLPPEEAATGESAQAEETATE